MSSTPPARITRALELLAPVAGQRILEIGCGPGVAVELLADRLGGGITAIDRSATAVSRAARRNAEHVDAGRVALHEVALVDAPTLLGTAGFDRVFAINVNTFWVAPDGPDPEAAAALLADGGRIDLFFDAPPGSSATRIEAGVRDAFDRHGLVSTVHADDLLTWVSAVRP